MYLTWYGQSTFKLQDKEVTLLLDPYSSRKVGLRGPNFKAEIVILSNKEVSDQAKKDIKEGFLIDAPGEYEIRGVFILGIKTKENKIVYQIEIDGLKIGYLGEINKPLIDEELEKLNGVDVLLVPIGNRKKVISAEEAIKIIREIEPKVVIPTCYQIDGLKIPLDSLNKFLKEMGVKVIEELDKIRLTKKDLPEETKVVVLKTS